MFVIAGAMRVPTRATVRAPMFVALTLVGLLLAFGAFRLRKLRRDGRLILTGFVLLVLVSVFLRPLQVGSLGMFLPMAAALYYLWFGSGAHVLGDRHARALARTPGRRVPTATRGLVVFGLIAAVWVVAGLGMVTRG